MFFFAALSASGSLFGADTDYSPPQIEDRPEPAPLYSAHVEAGLLPAVKLKPSAQLVPLPRASKDPRPLFISADQLSGKNDVVSAAQGNVELRKIGNTLTADRLTYWHEEDLVEASGNVCLTQKDDVITGPKLRMRVEDNVGFFEEPQYSIKHAAAIRSGGQPGQLTTGSGKAKRIDFEGENHYRLTESTYSTCSPTNPDWYTRAGTMSLDYDVEEGEARDSTLVFQGVPILYAPWLGFSLNNHRKSGLLTPTLGTTSKGGMEMTLPYYWNIAPNMDATISPRLMGKRGVQWNNEFRYLEPNYNGIVRGEYLPNDQITHTQRSSYSLQHNQNFGRGFSGNLNLNGVSDDTYFSDLSSRLTNIAQNNLLRQGVLAYNSTWWNASVMAQRYQTLQDPALPPVALPYRRLPQFTLNATRWDLPLGGAFTFNGEYVNFSHPALVEGSRTTLYPQLSLPLQTAAFYITPKLALHSTSYALERQGTGVPDKITRNVPIFSVDSGVTFERNLDLFGRNLMQTLEPRLYYLYVPTREQSQIPVFDTGLADFNFAQIFSNNRYSGGDRIGDANQLTTAVTSRLLDQTSGAELLRGALGQRYYFKPQQVTLPGEIMRTTKTADFLAALTAQIIPKVYIDTGWQFDPHGNRTDRLSLVGRYQPELGKVVSAGYRYNRDLINPTNPINQVSQIDISGQWPLWGGWSGVGRYNYSVLDHRIIETVGGIEYNGGCWVSRVVIQRIATATGDSSTAFFFQLELNGFSNIGSNPMDMLKRNIPGYGRINQPVADPAFAAN
ncbi:MAG: LPS-assembly protein LptD [Sterolibacterium sp.]